MRWCAVLLVLALCSTPLCAQEREGWMTSHDIAERWLHDPFFYRGDCTDPNYQVIVPAVFNPVVKLLLLGPNQIRQGFGKPDLEFQFPGVFIPALPNGCRKRREDKERKEVLKEAAIDFALQGTVGTVVSHAKQYLPKNLEVEVDVDDVDVLNLEGTVRVTYRF